MGDQGCTMPLGWRYCRYGYFPLVPLALVAISGVFAVFQPPFAWFLSACVVLLAFYVLLCHFVRKRVRLVIDSEGVEIVNLWRRARIQWPEIETVGTAQLPTLDRVITHRLRFVRRNGKRITAVATSDMHHRADIERLFHCLRANAPHGLAITATPELLLAPSSNEARESEVGRLLRKRNAPHEDA